MESFWMCSYPSESLCTVEVKATKLLSKRMWTSRSLPVTPTEKQELSEAHPPQTPQGQVQPEK